MDEQEIKRILDDHEERIKKLEDKKSQEIEVGENVADRKKLSIKEFLIEKNPSNDVKKTTCIGYYLEKYDGVESLTAKNITEGFRKAKVKVPLNVPDKIQKSISNGWIAPGSKKREYYVTITGEEAVKNSFNNTQDGN